MVKHLLSLFTLAVLTFLVVNANVLLDNENIKTRQLHQKAPSWKCLYYLADWWFGGCLNIWDNLIRCWNRHHHPLIDPVTLFGVCFAYEGKHLTFPYTKHCNDTMKWLEKNCFDH